MVTITPVKEEREWQVFGRVPGRVYRDDPHWIPVLDVNLPELLDGIDREDLEVQAFVASVDGDTIGRVVVIVDDAYNKHNDARTAFFGFYEVTNDEAAAKALLRAACDWARHKGLSFLMGPMNPTLIHGAGIVVAGGGKVPLVGMPHTPPYYADQMDACGFHKVKDMHSFFSERPYEKVVDLKRKWSTRVVDSRLKIRSLEMDRFDREVEHLRRIYNAAFTNYWGFAPVSQSEFAYLTHSFKAIIDPELVLFATLDDEPVAFLMGIPDVNGPLARACRWKNPVLRGASVLWNMKGPGRRALRHIRIDMLAKHPDCADASAAAQLTFEMLRRIHDRGYTSIEVAPLLEDASWGPALRAQLFENPARVYRVFGRAL